VQHSSARLLTLDLYGYKFTRLLLRDACWTDEPFPAPQMTLYAAGRTTAHVKHAVDSHIIAVSQLQCRRLRSQPSKTVFHVDDMSACLDRGA